MTQRVFSRPSQYLAIIKARWRAAAHQPPRTTVRESAATARDPSIAAMGDCAFAPSATRDCFVQELDLDGVKVAAAGLIAAGRGSILRASVPVLRCSGGVGASSCLRSVRESLPSAVIHLMVFPYGQDRRKWGPISCRRRPSGLPQSPGLGGSDGQVVNDCGVRRAPAQP